jgi:uncharacterized repeat protein (TIGR03806 family)
MSRTRRAALWTPLLGALLLSACTGSDDGDSGTPDAAPLDDRCAIAPGDGVSFDAASRACDKLSSYRFFVGDLAALEPNQRVVPYDLNSPLFSDYTSKYRFLYLPDGAAMSYHPELSFDLPVGAVIIKTFAYLDDMRAPEGPRRLLETRLLFRTADKWDVATYLWNPEQTEAYREVAGRIIDVDWVDEDGQPRELAYAVPNNNQCKNCHEEHDDITGPIGPKARHLNREYGYPGGARNQLEYLAELGMLDGLPGDPAQIARAAVWNDEQSGTLEERARAWLDINCAHCHNPSGAARTSGLDLSYAQANPYEYGVCKAPVAAGGGSGGRAYNIVPGLPDESILVLRLESTEPDVRMPEVGRQLVHEESVAVIRAWIEAMPGDCATVPGP